MDNTLKKTIISWLCDNPRYCLIFTLLFIIGCWSGLPNLGFSGDYRNLFDTSDPYLQKLDEINDNYIQSSHIIFVIRDAKDDIFNEKNFSIIEDITEMSWQTPHSLRVDSITNFHRIYSKNDTFFVEPLRDTSNQDSQHFPTIKNIATTQKSITDRLISKDGKTTAVVISIFLPEENRQKALADSVNFARNIQAVFHKNNPNLDIHLTGEVVMDQVLLEIIQSDMTIVMSLMMLVGFFILWFLLRSFFAVICTWLIIALSLSCAMGISGWGGYIINNISSASPMTIMIIAIADAIHILTPFLITLRQGADKKTAIQKSLDINFMPITITSLTTAIGFIGLNFASASAFRDFGNIIAFGVLAAYILSLVLLPALILLLPIKSQHRPFALTSLSSKIAKFSVRYAKLNLIWTLLLTIFCLFQL
ncbi:MAG: MMPL family transporter, partial [Pseudomonadales bacterium]|nr:MMPL family transporter [Pseudomonadales bacterium]